MVGSFPQIILLTDDESNRNLAQEKGITCCSGKFNICHSALNCRACSDGAFYTRKLLRVSFLCCVQMHVRVKSLAHDARITLNHPLSEQALSCMVSDISFRLTYVYTYINGLVEVGLLHSVIYVHVIQQISMFY